MAMSGLIKKSKCGGCFKFLDDRSNTDNNVQKAPFLEFAKGTRVTMAPDVKDSSPANATPMRSPSRFSGLSWGQDRETIVFDQDTMLLNKCFDAFKQGRGLEACEHLAEDCVWHTMYAEEIKGRTAIVEWRDAEMRRGRRNRSETMWTKEQDGMYKREMKVIFPSKATHQVVQTVVLQAGKIKEIVVKPKYAALSVALKFAVARAKGDDEEALRYMADDVRWKAWDGFHVEGKEGIAKLFREQRMKEVSRHGESEFEAAQVNDQGGVFERLLYVERVDGIKVKAKQRLYVRSELSEVEPVCLAKGEVRKCYGLVPKIIEVKVLATEEMIDGTWVVTEDGHM
eukprot:CAMPEP_0176104816 /NCGR_PEP_ID=MMETSP0120_2-20121206/52596_1 /TAXON_ID=160619 /ORGANISM="Kryptoperidinium foliaceum, Strain CCMP 1326" /LENGTH=340 /DNA_ID=CAMNT_0017438925 /DNA_START=61 /DNA_END=1083 /DNA_ORIENTATION=-